ncbi:hypothetical protein Emag_005819 [Eimeria magna]
MEKEGGLGLEGPLKLLFLRGPHDRSVVYEETDLPPEPDDANLPPQLTSDTPDSFVRPAAAAAAAAAAACSKTQKGMETTARDSLIRRIPNDIIGRVLQENQVYLQLHPRSKQLLLQLQDEMRNADATELRPLECFEASSEGGPHSGGPSAERGGGPRVACTRDGGPQGGPLSPCGFCRKCEERDVRMWNEVLLKEALKERRVFSKIPWILAEVYCYR